MQQSRQLVVAASASYEYRTEKYLGRDHLVVPVVALVQGVVHAMNSAHAELVTAEEFSRKPAGWNGRPIFHGHPERQNTPVSGNDPEVLESECIGIVFNSAVRKNKLTMEAWIDVERAAQIAPDLLSRVKNKQPIEISVGVFVDTDEAVGEYNGKQYLGSWHDIVPDHLALLPRQDEGACSIEMGCGVRAAKGVTDVESMYAEWLEPGAETDALLKTLRNIPADQRNQMADEDFAGPNRSFPIAQAEDVSAAAQSLGRAKGNRNDIKRRIVAIAYRKGDSYVAALPEDWKKKADQKNAKRGLLTRMLDAFRGAQDATEMTADDLTRRLYEALKEVEPNLSYVQTYHPVTDPAHVVYSCWIPSTDAGSEYGMGYQTVMYERAFDLADNGTITLNAARIEVEPVMRYEPVEGTQPTVATSNQDAPKDAASGAPCSCQHPAPTAAAVPPSQEEKEVMYETITKALGDSKATPEQEATVVTFIAGGFKAAETVVEKVIEKSVTVDMTREQAIEKFGFGDAVQALAARKTATISALKATGRCKMTDAELEAKGQNELDQLVDLAGSNVRAAIDFGGNGSPRAESKNEAPAPPSLDEALKADRK